MWHDVEATSDLLNFSLIAETAAGLIHDAGGQPISIGVSGSWGTGKSSLVKMIGTALGGKDSSGKPYLFVEFNAWLYQGFDDAKLALLQAVSDVLSDEANRQKNFLDKAIDFAKRLAAAVYRHPAFPFISITNHMDRIAKYGNASL
ncbi:hypothetical protein BN2475_70104 [Paraburkholderia ribeironis]|uniref:KAP NTPase domain-containing protein n=1 Tax=Paraburkholderia ribeironis TaxID=1247936 RepID=A0A1N7RLZ1_9BURK|nr:P-loop NTPase fold protein [Paraburkholderia ribeironis]SIT36139.1 hypothetical protein BN2475_70104 [Paraburkholderia ribeironis]